MSTELVIPGSGELIDLAGASDQQLVEVAAFLRTLRDQVSDARAALDSAIAHRFDQANLEDPSQGYTHRIAGYKVSAAAPTAGATIDTAALRDDLLDHYTELDIPPATIEGLFERTITYSRRPSAWANLVKQRPAIDHYLQQHSRPATSRRVTITRLPALRDVIDATAIEEGELA